MYEDKPENISDNMTQAAKDTGCCVKEELDFILENMSEIISRISIDGIIEFVSHSFIKYMGYKRDDLIGKSMAGLYHPGDREKFLNGLKSCIKFSSSVQHDLRFRNDKGEYIWVETILSPILNSAGQVVGAAACSRNIMQQKALEAFAMRNKSKYHSLFENMDTGFAYFKVVTDQHGNPFDFIFLECNYAFKRIIGFTNDNLIGKKVSGIIKIKDKWYLNILEKAIKVSLTGEPTNFEMYIKAFRRYVTCSIYCPHEGCIAVLAGDITEFKNKDELKRMIMYFSVRLINTPSEKIDDEIHNTLHVIGKFYDAECSHIFLYDRGKETLNCRYEWQIDGLGASIINCELKSGDFRWLTGEINNHKDIQILNLEEIPGEASIEKIYFQSKGYKSMIFMPITYESKVLGFVDLSSFNSKKTWTSEQVDLLKIVCTMLASAIKRKESEEALQTEINELVRLKRVLQDSEEKYRKLTLSIQDAIVLIDCDEKIVNWNKAAEKTFGYSYKEVLGRKLHMLIAPPDILSKAEEGFDKFKATGTGRFIDRITETDAMKKDGSRFRAEVSLSNVIIKGKSHVVGIVRNITERKEAQKRIMQAMEAAEAANKAKSQFLANMSHEIRTPMNGIIGFLDLLSKTSLDSQQQDYVKEMIVASDSLMVQINDLLDFSKIEANRLELEHIEFNLREVIEEVAALFSPKANSKGVEIHAMIHNSIPGLVKGDPVRLRQVIENLVSNAVKFTNKGEVLITAKLVSQSEEKLDVLFQVADTGIGISKSDRERLFEPFSQLDASTTRKYGGTGLGLTISEKIVEMMSGVITVKSMKGKGSKFIFKVSFGKVHDAHREKQNSITVLKGLDILVVDDSSTNRKIISYYLKSAGCHVSEAENGENAIKILREGAFRGNKIMLAMLDYNLQGLNGLDFAARIKSDKLIKDTVLILLSSFNGPSDAELQEKAGISNILLKPVYKSDLFDCILKSLGKLNQTTFENTENIAKNMICDKKLKKGVKILLVEDNETNQKLAVSILKTAGLKCDMADNGYKAIEMLEKNDYDLILMDCQMPEMDGYEATRLIRRRESGKNHIKIIAMTANAMRSDYDNCIKAGMDDYISKPFKAKELLEIIDKWQKKDDLESDNIREPQQSNLKGNNLTKGFGDDIPELLDGLARDQLIDRDVVYQIFNEFVEKLPEVLKKMQNAVDAVDFKAITLEAHTLKGSSAGLRLKSLSQIAASLEKQSREQNASLCRLSMDSIVEYCNTYLKKIT